MLDIRGLMICNQWFSYEFSSKSFNEVKTNFIKQIDFLSFFGAKVIGGAETGNSIHGHYNIPISRRTSGSNEMWNKLIKGLNELGKISFNEYGIKLCYHHHVGTMVESISDVDRLLNETDEKYVNLNYDCGHFYLLGEDPFEAIKKFISRTSHIHFKDVRKKVISQISENDLSFLMAVKKGVFTVPGDGDIEMRPLAEVVHNDNYEGWLVVEAEQDPNKANPYEYAKKGYEFLKNELKF
jgi:inosose dehydratase